MNQNSRSILMLGVIIIFLLFFAVLLESYISSRPVPSDEFTRESTIGSAKEFVIPDCGIKITYNSSSYPDPRLSISGPEEEFVTLNRQVRALFGDHLWSDISVTCIERIFDVTDLDHPSFDYKPSEEFDGHLDERFYDIARVLKIQSSGVETIIHPSVYGIFSEETLAQIDSVYSARNRGYKLGSEHIGFNLDDWMVEIIFPSSDELLSTRDFKVEIDD